MKYGERYWQAVYFCITDRRDITGEEIPDGPPVNDNSHLLKDSCTMVIRMDPCHRHAEIDDRGSKLGIRIKPGQCITEAAA